jgi:hypothetical protein
MKIKIGMKYKRNTEYQGLFFLNFEVACVGGVRNVRHHAYNAGRKE